MVQHKKKMETLRCSPWGGVEGRNDCGVYCTLFSIYIIKKIRTKGWDGKIGNRCQASTSWSKDINLRNVSLTTYVPHLSPLFPRILFCQQPFGNKEFWSSKASFMVGKGKLEPGSCQVICRTTAWIQKYLAPPSHMFSLADPKDGGWNLCLRTNVAPSTDNISFLLFLRFSSHVCPNE